MQFKMSEGSLFAVLLRSPWWYSALIAVVLIALSLAALGSQYLVFGLAAALPFVGISGMAAYRQAQRPSARDVDAIIESAMAMPARDLAARMSAAYEKIGYEVVAFKGSAADMDLTRGWRRILVCSKRFKAAKTGIEPLKALVDSGKSIEATGFAYLALGQISDNARQFARDNNIEIIDGEGLAALLQGRVKPF
ncbi:MAG: restriction endonuclease [Burkholderiaceae bacterium]